MGRTKVFVGNLSFKTNDAVLAKEFEAAGRVASASIISRGTRSLGYGFVEMESEEEARKSVELLNKKNIDGREINVEIARPREEKPPQDSAAGANNAAPAGEGAPREGGNRGGRRGGRGGRGRFFRQRGGRGGNTRTSANGAPAGSPQGQEGNNNQAQQTGPSNAAPAGAAPQRERRQRAPRAPRNDAEKAPRTPSTDTLFVANLPFSINDAGLASIFEGLNIKAAHVVRKHNERSKGFGFVEFHNADDQQKALSAVDKKQIEGRELSVKVALTEGSRNGASPATGAAPAPENK